MIRSDEIIEEKKMEVINKEDLEIWSALTNQLTAQEFQTLRQALSELKFKPKDTVVAQGDKSDTLFFITQGSIKVSHQAGPRELFITTLNRGQIAGENFFSPSLWTVTLTSLTPSRVHVLQQSTLKIWQEQFPELRAKLHAFYLAGNTIVSIFEKKKLERRQDQRFTLMRTIQVHPVDSRGNPIGRGFRSETIDISYGGLAFVVRISRRESARLLLGRRMQIMLPVGGKKQFLTFKGMIIGIQPFQVLENDFSVHFVFDRPLDQQHLQAVLG
jgi:CRP-like cAMP-binding protein